MKFLQPLPRHRLFRFHHFHECIEQIRGIVRPRAGFRMVLHAEDGQILVPETFNGAVVQIDVRDDSAFGFERFLIDGKSVILAGDFDSSRVEVFHRLISAAMSEF